MAADSRRLSILTASEVDDLYGLPHFTEDDRQLYFELSPAEREAVEGVHHIGRRASRSSARLLQGEAAILCLRARGGAG